MICTKCYHEFSWLNEACPNCGAPFDGKDCDWRMPIARLVRWLCPQQVKTRAQFSLTRMFVSMTVIAAGTGLFAFLFRSVMSPEAHYAIQGRVTELGLLAGALVGAGAGLLARRPLIGFCVGAAAGIVLTIFLYLIWLALAYSQMQPPGR
jgi:hypothetical protein